MKTVREKVAELVSGGLRDAEIARRIGVAPPTVAYHRERLTAGQVPARTGGAPTHERIAALLEEGLSQTAVAHRLGLAKSTIAYHARRLGIPVNERCARRYDWGEVQRYYDEGHSVRECRIKFGFANESWNAAVRRGDVRPRPKKLPLDELLVAGVHRSRHNLKLRLLAEGVKEPACELCGLQEWLGKTAPLALHHVNGDRLDNRLENLELLCMNCHAQTANFSGRKKRAA